MTKFLQWINANLKFQYDMLLLIKMRFPIDELQIWTQENKTEFDRIFLSFK